MNAAGKRWTYTQRGYAANNSWRQLKQRKFASLVTLLVLGITLALPALFLFMANSLQQLSIVSVQDESLTLYLTLATSDLHGAEMAQQLLSRVEVEATQYVSRDEALATFRNNADVGAALDALGENPLPGAIVVFPSRHTLDAAHVQQLADSLNALPGVERVQLDLRWVQRLQAALALLHQVGWLLASFLMLTSLLVIGNTIRLELLRRQPELDVSELLGASRRFLQRPLLYTGVLYGFFGGLVACGIAVLALFWIKGPANELSTLYASAFRLELPTVSQLFTVLGIASLLGLLGALITLYRPSRQMFHTSKTAK